MTTSPGASPADALRTALATLDVDAVEAYVAEDCTFRSPAVHAPYQGKVATMLLLRSVARVFEDFHYVRSFTEDEPTDGEHHLGTGSGHVLVFRARVGERQVEGLDMVRFGEDGLVHDFRVLVRPQSGLAALVEAMGTVIPVVMAEMGLD